MKEKYLYLGIKNEKCLDYSSMVACLSNILGGLDLIPQHYINQAGGQTPTCQDQSSEVGGPELQGHLHLYSKFKTSLDSMRHCSKERGWGRQIIYFKFS